MKSFNDTRPDNAAVRLADLYEAARRFRRMGYDVQEVDPENLMLRFYDPRIRAKVRLEMMPWYKGDPGWRWDATIDAPQMWMSGSLGWDGWVIGCPRPRLVAKSYLRETRYERGPLPLKKNRRRR